MPRLHAARHGRKWVDQPLQGMEQRVAGARGAYRLHRIGVTRPEGWDELPLCPPTHSAREKSQAAPQLEAGRPPWNDVTLSRNLEGNLGSRLWRTIFLLRQNRLLTIALGTFAETNPGRGNHRLKIGLSAINANFAVAVGSLPRNVDADFDDVQARLEIDARLLEHVLCPHEVTEVCPIIKTIGQVQGGMRRDEG